MRVTAAGQTFLTLSGTVRFAQPIEVDWLLASMARPNRVVYREMLTKSTNYRWMEGDEDIELQTALRFRPAPTGCAPPGRRTHGPAPGSRREK